MAAVIALLGMLAHPPVRVHGQTGGLTPASRARMADYITCVRDLIATGEGTYDGRPQRVRWHGEAVRKRIPITLCAEGPKTLHLG